jgi:hypothetical protein
MLIRASNERFQNSKLAKIREIVSGEKFVAYASPQSKVGRIDCKSAPDLQKLMAEFFHNVFIFSMNEEMVHTGFHKMANYIFATGAGKTGRKVSTPLQVHFVVATDSLEFGERRLSFLSQRVIHPTDPVGDTPAVTNERELIS